MASRSFGDKLPVRSHLVRPGGLKGEIWDVRRDIEAAFTSAEAEIDAAGGFAGVQTYYVGKHGNDSNSGLNPGAAFLTFGKAMTEAAAQTPSASNQFAIVCEDAGEYDEAVTMAQYVSLFAPAATFTQKLTVADDTFAEFHEVTVPAGTIGVHKPSGQTGISRVECNVVRAAGDSTGALTEAAAGVLMLEARSVFAENGYGIGQITGTAQGHMHVMIEDLYITGTGGGLIRFGAGSTVGYIAHCLEVDGGVGNGTGIDVRAGTVALKMLNLSATNAINVLSGATLQLDVGGYTGTITGTGAVYLNTAGYVAGNAGDWLGSVPTQLNDALDRIAAEVALQKGSPIP